MCSNLIARFDSGGIRRAISIVKKGGVIVFPTDTVYGLGCDPMNERAIQKLFEVKKRAGKPIPVLCDGIESAERLVRFIGPARKLAQKYWPGALTIVLPLKKALPYAIHQGTRELGVRVPHSLDCVRLIRGCGGFITGTSANISGAPPARTAQRATEELGEGISLVLDGGTLAGTPSTVVKVNADGIEVLREGAVAVV